MILRRIYQFNFLANQVEPIHNKVQERPKASLKLDNVPQGGISELYLLRYSLGKAVIFGARFMQQGRKHALVLMRNSAVCPASVWNGYRFTIGKTSRRAVLQGLGALALLLAGPARAAQDSLAFRQVAPGTYVHVGHVAVPDAHLGGDTSNIGFVVGSRSVAVIDSGGAPRMGRMIVEAVRAVTDKPIAYLILTHMHPDHSAGAQSLREAGAQIVAHGRYDAAIAARSTFYAELETRRQGGAPSDFVFFAADIAVSDTLTLDLGGRRLLLKAWPTAHTDNDLTVLDEAASLLLAGDLLFSRHVPTLDGSLRGWLALLPELARIPARQVVPGHGPAPLPWPDALADERRYLERLAADIRAAIAAGRGLSTVQDTAAESERGRWELFDHYRGQNATAAYTELEWE